jgi:hypothetical protein
MQTDVISIQRKLSEPRILEIMLMLTPKWEGAKIGRYDEHLTHGGDAPCIQIRALVSGFSARVRIERQVVVGEIIQLAVDESGHGQSGHDEAFLFAGYVGSVPDWENFTHGFDALLHESPAMTPREFKRQVRSPNPDSRIIRSIDLANECSLRGFRYKINHNVFVALQALVLSTKDRDSYDYFKNSYFIAFAGTLLFLMASVRNKPDYQVELIYDEEMHERRRLERGYREFRKWAGQEHPEILEYIARRPVPRNDLKFWPLLLADALAYHSHKNHVESANGREYTHPLWIALKDIRFVVDDGWSTIDLLHAREHIADAMERAIAEARRRGEAV